MTESIFVPFRLTTKESVEKAVGILSSDPSPKVVSDQDYTLSTAEEIRAFEDRLKRKHARAEA